MYDLITKVSNTISKHHLIDTGNTVITGVSGGPDSVCLLFILKEISLQMGFKLHAVHVNHMLRGEESEADQKYVAELCKSLDIDLHIFRHEIREIAQREKLSLEEAGRKVRYEDFYKVAGQTGASRIAVAHNKNDQAETIMMHILRGTGLDGLKGMDYSRLAGDEKDKGTVLASQRFNETPEPSPCLLIRPLLGISRQEIEAYCREKGLYPRTDSSNLSDKYKRNRVRLRLLPLMDEITEASSVDMLCRMGDMLSDDEDFLREYSARSFDECKLEDSRHGIWLDVEKFGQCHPAIQKRIVRHALSLLRFGLTGIESVHVTDAVNLAVKGRTGAELQLPGGLRIKKSYGKVGFHLETNDNNQEGFEYCGIDIPGSASLAKSRGVLNSLTEKNTGSIEQYTHMGYNSLVQYFDYDKTGNDICIRNRKPGDIFKPLGCRGTKKLKEFLIDEKIPRDIRNLLPLVSKDNEIIWIIGYKISDKFKVTENTKNVLKLEFVHSSSDRRRGFDAG